MTYKECQTHEELNGHNLNFISTLGVKK